LAKIQFTGFSAEPTQLVTGEIVPILLPPVLGLIPSAVCIGTSMVINGVNVGNASSKHIGGDVATIVSNTNSEITVTVPMGWRCGFCDHARRNGHIGRKCYHQPDAYRVDFWYCNGL
jgi:hypothetical protein